MGDGSSLPFVAAAAVVPESKNKGLNKAEFLKAVGIAEVIEGGNDLEIKAEMEGSHNVGGKDVSSKLDVLKDLAIGNLRRGLGWLGGDEAKVDATVKGDPQGIGERLKSGGPQGVIEHDNGLRGAKEDKNDGSRELSGTVVEVERGFNKWLSDDSNPAKSVMEWLGSGLDVEGWVSDLLFTSFLLITI